MSDLVRNHIVGFPTRRLICPRNINCCTHHCDVVELGCTCTEECNESERIQRSGNGAIRKKFQLEKPRT